jgi:O-antigen/teichoic acid export membrane protein
MLGAELYGTYRLAVTVVTILAGISMVGLDAGIRRYIAIALRQEDEGKIAGIVRIGVGLPLIVSLTLSTLVALGSEIISEEMFHTPGLAPVLRIAAMAVPIMTLANCFASIAVGYRRVEYDVYTQDIAWEAIKVALSLGAIFLGMGVIGVTYSFGLSALIALIPLAYLVNRLFPIRRALGPVENNSREVIRFSLPIFLSTLLNQFGRRLETLVLGMFSIVSNVGVYSAMLSISSIGTLANVALRGIATPIIADLHSREKFDDLKKFYQTITKWSVIFNLPVFLTVLLFSENLLSLLGPEFTVGAFGLLILAFGNLVDASTGVCGVMISYSGHSKVTLINSITYLVSSVGLSLLMIPPWGLEGAAWAGAITIILINSIRLVQVYVLIHRSSPFNWSFLKPVTASLVAGVSTFLLQDHVLTDSPVVQLVVLSAFMIGVYVLTIIFLKLSYEDRLVIERLWVGIIRRGGKRDRKKRDRDKRNEEGGLP